MVFKALDSHKNIIDKWTVYSIGGGALAEENKPMESSNPIYNMHHMNEILNWCEINGKNYWEYVKDCEESDIWDYLSEIWKAMP